VKKERKKFNVLEKAASQEMKKQNNILNNLIEETLSERQWNKDSKTPRDYSKEYNPPGSKEQEERNKRKRDKRKHDKEHGECPHEQELHHVDGIEKDKVECEPPYINRGRKEKSRLKKDELVIKIKEQELKKIVQEEVQKLFDEGMFSSLANMTLQKAQAAGLNVNKWGQDFKRGTARGKAVGSFLGGGPLLSKAKAAKVAKQVATSATEKPNPVGTEVGAAAADAGMKTYKDVTAALDAVFGSTGNLKGNPNELVKMLQSPDTIKAIKDLKHAGDVKGVEEPPGAPAATPPAVAAPGKDLTPQGLLKDPQNIAKAAAKIAKSKRPAGQSVGGYAPDFTSILQSMDAKAPFPKMNTGVRRLRPINVSTARAPASRRKIKEQNEIIADEMLKFLIKVSKEEDDNS
jgi:hypothetical protein